MITFGHIIAFDFGTRSIGVAVGQCITYTAQPLMALKARKGIPEKKHIIRLFNEWQPEIIVVGLPLNMNGSEQIMTYKTRQFANKLHSDFGIQVILHDERLSTFEARIELFKKGGYRALEKRRIDSSAAVLILESWFKQFYNIF